MAAGAYQPSAVCIYVMCSASKVRWDYTTTSVVCFSSSRHAPTVFPLSFAPVDGHPPSIFTGTSGILTVLHTSRVSGLGSYY